MNPDSRPGEAGTARSSEPIEIAALTALYQAERADNVTMQGINATVVGLAITYAAATSVLLNQAALSSVNPWIIALLPAPLWFVSVFLGEFSTLIARRQLSGLVLERRLAKISGLTDVEKGIVGLTGSQHILNFQRGSWLAKIAGLTAFGGELLLVISYTILMLTQSFLQGSDPATLFVFIPAYLLILAIFAANGVCNDRRRKADTVAVETGIVAS